MKGDDLLRVTTPSPREIVMTCTFDAPRTLVFGAFTRPDLLRRWLGRPGDEMTSCDVDLRAGGGYRYEFRLRPDASGAAATFREVGSFREVDPPRRIVATEAFDDFGETTVATTFHEEGGRTTISVTCTYATPEARDSVLASGVEDGARESYARLADLLRSLA
jgi:uncharacterized protein YndB with AHSA1/START domain